MKLLLQKYDHLDKRADKVAQKWMHEAAAGE